MKRLLALLLFTFACVSGAHAKVIYEADGLRVAFDGKRLTLVAPEIEAAWQWTGRGLRLSRLKDPATEKEWLAPEKEERDADWDTALFGEGIVTAPERIVARRSDDEGFTSPHLEIETEIRYPSGRACLYRIWVYPGQAGLRTQLLVKGTPSDKEAEEAARQSNEAAALTLSLPGDSCRIVVAGYYNDHDRRNSDHEPLLREERFTHRFTERRDIGWASLAMVETERAGLILLKESHKTVNLNGTNTGRFLFDGRRLTTTGLGLSERDLSPDEYRPCWAHWIVLYAPGDCAGELALKRFDRYRYPVDTKRDLYIMANVWGSGRAFRSAEEKNILREIASCAGLGIDVLQIDAGWHLGAPKGSAPWLPSPKIYPRGWKPVMRAARESGIEMGIWNPGLTVAAHPQMLSAHFDAGFRYMKVDLKSWDRYDDLQAIVRNVREMETHSNHRGRVNFDVTARWIRVGYWFAREYGNLFLQNRRQQKRAESRNEAHVRGSYVPRRILRDGMDIARYMNTNQVQLNTLDVSRTDPAHTNAARYGNAYSLALTLMHMPLFFQETWMYGEEDRSVLTRMIVRYKLHREAIFTSYVFPIGERGDDRSWGGYQAYRPDEATGYVSLFREIDNCERRKRIRLHFLHGPATLSLEEIFSGETLRKEVDAQGTVEFEIDKPADFRFYKYTLIPKQ